jgi:5,10-methylenetetrahydrofolate reductase
MTDAPFELICEIEPATTPDLTRVRHQIGVLSPVATSFLIPDNHIGRATVSSVAVAHEVQLMGGRSIACLNARDRNLLGFRRDLLTAAAYGVDEFLFIYGDDPLAGARTSELTVRTMLAEGRAYAETLTRSGPGGVGRSGGGGGGRDGGSGRHAGRPAMRFGAASGLRPLPDWKRAADFLFVQVGFSLDDLLAWRATVEVDVPVYAGVIVIASAAMARNFTIPGLTIPPELVARLETDRNAGVDAACDLVVGIKESGAFDGVHLIPVARYREVAARLERDLR